jgi:hypothetical protein
MASPSSAGSYSPSFSHPSLSTWSASPYTSPSDCQYSSPNAAQPGSSQSSNITSPHDYGGPCPRCYQFNCICYVNSYFDDPFPNCRQDVSSAAGVYESDEYGSPSWSRSNSEAVDGTSAAGSQNDRGGSTGMNQYSPRPGDVGISTGNSFRPLSVDPTISDAPNNGYGVGYVVGGAGDGSDGWASEDRDGRLSNQTDGRRRSGSEQDEGYGLIQCSLGCRCKRGFKNQQSFEAHLRNVHYDKIWGCQVENCPRPGPFSNKTGLERHTRTAHDSAKPFRCQRPNCSARAKAFKRKDKLKDHDRKHHSNFKCFYCSQDPRLERWFEYEREFWEHTNEKHFGWDNLDGHDYRSPRLLLNYQDHRSQV